MGGKFALVSGGRQPEGAAQIDSGMNKPMKRIDEPETPFWPFNLLAIVILVLVCYWKLPSFRHAVDAKIPWLHTQTASFFTD